MLLVRDVKEILGATVLAGGERLDTPFEHVYASDLMSDVLAFGQPNSLLLTGLATQQAVVSALMAEFVGVVFLRGKRPKDGCEQFAGAHGLVVLGTSLDMYEACVQLDSLQRGQSAASGARQQPPASEAQYLTREFTVKGGDFVNAGLVSTEVKSLLKTIGFDPALIRRVAIATYEGEMNVVMHAQRGVVQLVVDPQAILVTISDQGNGIADIDLAMQEGYSTATEEMRAMGFGSGMGLPNMKKNADEFFISSEVGKGTLVRMKFLV